MFPDWDYTLIVVSASFHGVAILCTLFRLWYRCYIARIWWDDACALLALSADIICLIVALLEQPIPYGTLPQFFETGNWMFSFAYPILMWSTRVSILTSVVRVSNPEGLLKRVALGVGISFGLMGTVGFALRLHLCIVCACLMTRPPLITQTVTECVADVLLSVLPLWFLRRMNLSRQTKILLSSAFLATMVINIVTVIEAVVLLRTRLTSGTIIFEHVKTACSLIVCNLLVIDTFIYRVTYKNKTGMADSVLHSSRFELTTVELCQTELSQDRSIGVATTKSSSWSFHGDQSTMPGSAAAAASWTDARQGEE